MSVEAPEQVGRRERKKLQTRRTIAEAALRLFAERGFERTTIEDITEAVDLAPRTFFRHFASKEDVLLAEKRAQLEALRAFLEAAPAGAEPLEVVCDGLSRIGTDYERQKATVLLQAQLVEQTPSLIGALLRSYAEFETTITAAVARLTGSDPRRDVYPALVASTSLSAMRTALALWCAGGCRGHLPTLTDRCFAMLATGLRRPPAPGPEGSLMTTPPHPGGLVSTLPSGRRDRGGPSRRSGGSLRRRGDPSASPKD